ncbi:MAG: hypothetical protein U5N58_07915 [Actinomycetota bacterium]|nr:hypothetical protein [Actinomycetota bacterium]
MANIYSIGTDGSDRELIFSDIDYFWDLGRVYSVSPDGRWLVCSFFEGGRGAYRSLSLIDTETGDLEQIVEFDYTQDGIEGEQKQVYGQPVWSQDGSMLAYEVINIPPEPRVESYNTDWIQVYNLNSKEVKQVIPRIGGMCATKLTFMQPVLFLPDGRLAVVYHGFYSSAQDETDIYSANEEVYLMNLESADITQIMDVDYFDQVEQVQSFSNFRLWENSIVFEILGDFEEDGDIYSYVLQEKNIEQVTSDTQLREQQPDAAEGKLCYVGVPRYGTIAYSMPAGDIYVLEGQQHKKITEFDLEACQTHILSPRRAV